MTGFIETAVRYGWICAIGGTSNFPYNAYCLCLRKDYK